MIKKARDIKLGDRIGGKAIFLIEPTPLGSRHFYTTDMLHDRSMRSIYVHDDQVAWVDDPETMLPVLRGEECCKPVPTGFSINHITMPDVRKGDVLCLAVDRIESGNRYRKVWLRGAVEPTWFQLNDSVQMLEGGDNRDQES